MFKDAEEYGKAWQSHLAKERLEKAAPALLEALEEVTGYVEYMVGCGHLSVSALDHSRKSRAAIAAAKGE